MKIRAQNKYNGALVLQAVSYLGYCSRMLKGNINKDNRYNKSKKGIEKETREEREKRKEKRNKWR
jgi:hypothetical protein